MSSKNKKTVFNDPSGRIVIPSLVTKEQEENFKIYPSWFVDDNSFNDSIRKIRVYYNADEYRSVYMGLNESDVYLLKFIANFKSVQKIHLIREARLFPEIFNASSINTSIKHLFMNNLIWKWKYKHPVYGENIDVYTLSSNGYYLLKTLFGSEHYFFPTLLLSPRIPDVFHIRFWETIDLYQIFASLPIYQGSTTLFSGNDKKHVMKSPLQVSLQLINDSIQKLVIYPNLQTDSSDYYKSVIEKWSDIINDGANSDIDVNGLPGETSVLTFYSPSLSYAKTFAKTFELGQYNFPILIIVGSIIKSHGIEQAFLAPVVGDKDNQLKQIKINRISDNADD